VMALDHLVDYLTLRCLIDSELTLKALYSLCASATDNGLRFYDHIEFSACF